MLLIVDTNSVTLTTRIIITRLYECLIFSQCLAWKKINTH